MFTTDDMTLVGYLKVNGIEPARMEKVNGGCRWFFSLTVALDDLVLEYTREEACVEPRDFARKLGLVRQEMYRFIGHQAVRVRS